jgi:hypothetical protein
VVTLLTCVPGMSAWNVDRGTDCTEESFRGFPESLQINAAIVALSALTSALVGGEWAASRPCRFTPWEKGSRYPLYGGAEWAPEAV